MTKETSPPQPITSVTTAQPAVPAPPPATNPAPEPERSSPVPGRDGCVVVTVLDADGDPATGVRVGLMDESAGGGPSARFNGRTGPKGHWQQCGLTPGHNVRVAALGLLGGLLSSQTGVVATPRTFITIRLQQKRDDAPQRIPERKGPFRRRP